MVTVDPFRVTDFWFGPKEARGRAGERDFWFKQSKKTDEEVRLLFGPTVDAALIGKLDDWSESDEGSLALILVLDQFTRNVHRGKPEAFAGDSAAVSLAKRMVESGADRRFSLLERWFIYMPFEHSERVDDQEESIHLFTRLATDGLPDPLPWAQRHCEVIRRFGRFPHRNRILGRASTSDEEVFLRQPGSSF